MFRCPLHSVCVGGTRYGRHVLEARGREVGTLFPPPVRALTRRLEAERAAAFPSACEQPILNLGGGVGTVRGI